MKELSIEEKAKAYDDAIKKAEALYKAAEPMSGCNVLLETVFPELKESGGERIRKELINYFIKGKEYLSLCSFSKEEILAWLEKQGEPQIRTGIEWVNIMDDACDNRYAEEYAHGEYCHEQSFRWGFQEGVAWLEKQDEQKPVIEMKSAEESLGIDSDTYNEIVDECIYGEQKPTDKVEPKFKVGDIIIKSHNSDINKFGKFKITGIKDGRYWYNEFIICEISEQDKWELVKIEPKFKVGDWVVDNCGYVWKIEGILNQFYILEGVEEDESRPTIEWVDKTFHLWAIQDAKDGDVLIYNHQPFKWIFIFKCLYNPILVSYYVMFTEKNKICIDDSISTNFLSKITPATKEQRNLLFQKMKEAGYEWDENNKELKKVDEIEESDFFDDFRNSDVEVDSNEDGLIASTVKYKNEQKQTWNKEDDNCLSTIIAEFSKCAGKSVSKDEWMRCNDFLNSLRDRVQSSPKQEWSEDDEEMIEGLNNCLDELEKERNWIYVYVNNKNVKLNKVRSWLKSIKPQSQWKPSNEQMQVIEWCKPLFVDPRLKEMLDSLINDLKKLL